MNWETLLSIGDSITYGARSYAGYPEYAAAELENSLSRQWNVINFSISGLKTIDISRKLSNNYSNIMCQNPSIVTIMTGTNDIKANVNIEDYVMALSQVITKVKILCGNVILLKLPFFTKGVMHPYKYAMNETVEKYNQQIEIVSKRHNISCFTFSYCESYFFDGVHLNDAGSKAIGQQLATFILSDRGIEYGSK